MKRNWVDVDTEVRKKACSQSGFALHTWLDVLIQFHESIVEFLCYNFNFGFNNNIKDRFQVWKTCRSLRNKISYPTLRELMTDCLCENPFLRMLASLKWCSFLKGVFVNYKPDIEPHVCALDSRRILFACHFQSHVQCFIVLKVNHDDDDDIEGYRIKMKVFYQKKEGDVLLNDAFTSCVKPESYTHREEFFLQPEHVLNNHIKWPIAQRLVTCLQNQMLYWAADDYKHQFGPWDPKDRVRYDKFEQKQMLVYQKRINELLEWKPDEFQEPCLSLEDWKKQIYSDPS